METFLKVFQERCKEQGQKTALVCGSEQITYEELGRRSDQIAKFLQKKGTSKDEVVAVLLERSIDCIAAFLGIWKAGSAFTYLSNKFPKERIQLICQDCHVRILLDKEALSSALAQSEKDSFSGAYPALDDAAMALYTSGSTGRPKGILHDHRSILHTVQRQLKVTGISSEDVILGNSPFYFVTLLLEVITPLYAGCTIHFFPEKDCRKIPLIESYMVEHAITASLLTVQLLKHFKNRSKTLRLVFTGSERVSQVKGEGYKLLNLYGSSETGGPIFGFFVDRRYENTPIGIPEEGTCAYLLDESGRLAAEGKDGELCLSGVFARGYIGLPEQTAAAFTKNPFFEQDGHAVLYHTGDIARWLPDGNLLYVNRKDWQVKINGQRVELGEIEVVLASVEGVEGAIVQAFTKKSGQNYLCAYYLAEEEISRQKLKKSLREKLPDYMVPEFFVRMESFPLNMNGKLDRKQLQAPKFHDQQIYRAPRTPLEKVICEGFSKVLKKPSIGLDSDFYLLGGDSLSAMELAAWLMEKQLVVQAEYMAKFSTPGRLAEALQRNSLEQLPAAEEKQPTESFAMSDAQKMMTAFDLDMMKDGVDESYLRAELFFELEASVIDFARLQTVVQETRAALDVFHIIPDFSKQQLKFAEEGDLKISLTEEKEKYRLTLQGNHLFFDGVFIQQLLQYLSDGYNQKNRQPFQSFYTLSCWLEAVRKVPLYAEAESYYKEMKKAVGDFQYDVQPEPNARKWRAVLSNRQVPIPENLSDVCARLNCTRYQLFYALYVKTLSLWRSGPVCCFSVLNQRQYAQVARVAGCATNRFYVFVQDAEKYPLQELLQVVKKGIEKGQQYGIYPAWKVMDPELQEFPYFAFNYAETASSQTIYFGEAALSERQAVPSVFFDIPLLLELELGKENLQIIFLGREDRVQSSCLEKLAKIYSEVLAEAVQSL